MNVLVSASRRGIPSVARRQLSTTVTAREPLKLTEHKYTATAVASGEGRNGTVESGGLKLKLSTPKELGGSGEGENPEQLFAMGYAGCFLGAVRLKAQLLKKEDQVKNAVVYAKVHIGPPAGKTGLALAVDLEVEGVDSDIIEAAHKICPYSRAVDGNIVVNVRRRD